MKNIITIQAFKNIFMHYIPFFNYSLNSYKEVNI